jgi:hypothetical protein
MEKERGIELNEQTRTEYSGTKLSIHTTWKILRFIRKLKLRVNRSFESTEMVSQLYGVSDQELNLYDLLAWREQHFHGYEWLKFHSEIV